jgi:hypothetical protein
MLIPQKKKSAWLSPFEQLQSLKAAQPDSKVDIITHKQMRWRGHLRPSPLSKQYEIAIRYSSSKCFPCVFVLNPKLQQFNGQPIPHRYGDGSLCLFRPSKKEWNGTMRISDTILPWASLWLYYYEIWLATGEWLGGGEHPTTEAEKQASLNSQSN